MPTQIRFSTLLRKYGPVQRATNLSDKDWQAAVKDGRFATIYHADGEDWCTPVVALVRHHGCVNTICKFTFSKPLPPAITEIIGLRHNQDAWDLCNP